MTDMLDDRGGSGSSLETAETERESFRERHSVSEPVATEHIYSERRRFELQIKQLNYPTRESLNKRRRFIH